MQNYSVKKQETVFTVCIKITTKNKKKHSITSCPKFSSLTLQYAKLCTSKIETKLIPFIYHKNCIRYSIFKYNVSALTGADI
jgi:hypothetical protein